MICTEAAEFVSALCDAEIIPRAAAEHIGSCEVCKARMHDYLAIGVELRCLASGENASILSARAWTSPQNAIAKWWQKGRGSMRIPRLAFAALIASIIALGSTLAVVKVRAHDTGTVVLLTVTAGGNKPIECAVSTIEKREATCGSIGGIDEKTLGYRIDFLKRDGDRIQIGIRTRVWPNIPGARTEHSLSAVDDEPQQQFWFEAGETLSVDVPGVSPLTIRGNWLDHMPVFPIIGMDTMDPGPEDLRVVSPLLLRGKDVVGDIQGGSSIQDKRNWAVWIYYPKLGSYLVSLVPIKGSIEAQVNLNRITFKEAGISYAFLTGTPITRSKRLWVLHQPDFDPGKMGLTRKEWFIASQALVETSPGQWELPAMPK